MMALVLVNCIYMCEGKDWWNKFVDEAKSDLKHFGEEIKDFGHEIEKDFQDIGKEFKKDFKKAEHAVEE